MDLTPEIRAFHKQNMVPHSRLLVVVVQSAEEEAAESHLGEQVGLLPRVAEGIDLPCDARPAALSERLVQKLNGDTREFVCYFVLRFEIEKIPLLKNQ